MSLDKNVFKLVLLLPLAFSVGCAAKQVVKINIEETVPLIVKDNRFIFSGKKQDINRVYDICSQQKEILKNDLNATIMWRDVFNTTSAISIGLSPIFATFSGHSSVKNSENQGFNNLSSDVALTTAAIAGLSQVLKSAFGLDVKIDEIKIKMQNIDVKISAANALLNGLSQELYQNRVSEIVMSTFNDISQQISMISQDEISKENEKFRIDRLKAYNDVKDSLNKSKNCSSNQEINNFIMIFDKRTSEINNDEFYKNTGEFIEMINEKKCENISDVALDNLKRIVNNGNMSNLLKVEAKKIIDNVNYLSDEDKRIMRNNINKLVYFNKESLDKIISSINKYQISVQNVYSTYENSINQSLDDLRYVCTGFLETQTTSLPLSPKK